MFYLPEFDFLQQVLTNMHLNYTILPLAGRTPFAIDLHLRKLLGISHDYDRLKDYFCRTVTENMICHITDSFYCRYSCLILPDVSEKTMLIVGPYVTNPITKAGLMQILEKNSLSPQLFPSCERYYFNIPCVDNHNSLTILLNTFGAKIWGAMDNFSVDFIFDNTPSEPHSRLTSSETDLPENNLLDMQALERRYTMENEFMQAVSQGLSHKARMLIGNSTPAHTQNRAPDALSSMKYYMIVLNTLLRKAAERGSVHPFHIDSLSADIAFKIDRCNSTDRGKRLMQEMVHKYCLLVKNHSMKGYSLLVQKAITRIESDLAADLSLRALAGFLNINGSYLSNLFKKETGHTLTEYVNRRRIDHGILLLNSTNLQIQTIAQYCGILDVNYFTKLFKRYIGKTPKEYREAVMLSVR